MPDYRLQFTAAFRRLAPRLFEQQMWCWGQDIRHKPNLLLEYGFDRFRATHDPDLSSCYHLLLYPAHQIVLWGFGAYTGSAESGIYLGRQGSRLQPLLCPTPLPPVTEWQGIPVVEPPHTRIDCVAARDHLAAFIRWVVRYERWISDQLGTAHRQAVLNVWKRKPVVVAEQIATTWQSLAASCDTAAIHEIRKGDTVL